MSVNKVILIGRLGQDPELKYTPGGRPVASFTLATNERWTTQDGQKQEKTTWHKIVAWGKQAEVINEYCRKGKQIYIEGRIDNRSYDDKEGNKRYISEVIIQNFQFLGSRDDTGGHDRPASAPSQAGGVSAPPDGAPPEDDDLPF